MSGLRIGVNALYLIPGGVGGTEIYLRNLLAALADLNEDHEYFIFTNRETGKDLVPDRPGFRQLPQAVRGENRVARILWEQLALPAAVRHGGLDVLLSPGFTTPFHCACPSVTVFHDLQHKRHPELFRRWDLPFWNLFLAQAARTSKALIAVSQATADDLARYYPNAASKTSVVHHGVEERFREISRERSPERFLLCVSTLHPHKNLERLLRVFAEFHKRRPDFSLVLAGMRGFHTEPVEQLVMDLGLNDAVRMPGWIAREELYDLYRRAWAFIYPSTFEGFGMPVLEAQAAGVPTACSDIAPLREVADPAAIFFDPSDEGEMLKAVAEITGDESVRSRLQEEGPEHASRYSWRHCAEQTLAILRAAVVKQKQR